MKQIVRLLLIVPLLPLMAGCEDKEPLNTRAQGDIVRPAKIVAVISSGLDFVRTYPGILEAADKAELAFRVSGQVSQLPAQAGLRVKKGQLLARLDDTDFRNSLDEREARYQLAKVQFDQAKKLLQQKLTSQLKYDQSEAELKSARAALQQAKANLDYTNIYAPFDGIIAQVNIQNFQSVQALTPIMTIQDDARLDIRFSVPESIISQLRRLENPDVIRQVCAKVYMSSHPEREFDACYKESESVPDPVTRNYSGLFSLGEVRELALLPGMTASIRIDFAPYLADEVKKQLFIPVEAVFEDQGKQWVWVVDEKEKAQKRQVFGGRFEGELMEITLGLEKTDKVIAAGVSFIREGMAVKPISKERGL